MNSLTIETVSLTEKHTLENNKVIGVLLLLMVSDSHLENGPLPVDKF